MIMTDSVHWSEGMTICDHARMHLHDQYPVGWHAVKNNWQLATDLMDAMNIIQNAKFMAMTESG